MGHELARDMQGAWRGLRRAPGLLVAGIASLAVGIGANLTALGLLRAIEFPALPYPRAAQLVQVDASNEVRQARGYPLSLPDYADVRARTGIFRDAGATTDDVRTLEDGAEPARLAVSLATPSYFTTLGVPAELGRPFAGTGSGGGVANDAVLGHRLWTQRYGGDRRIIGRVLRLDDASFTVIGVMPSRFDENVDVWLPLAPGGSAPRDDRRYTVVARLRDGVTLDRARSELARLASTLAAESASTNAGWEMSPTPMARLRSRESGGGYYQLQAAVAVLLLAACANIANLLLARTVSRRRELAVRSALGAGRAHLARLVLLEGVLLAAGGGVLGVILAQWGVAGAAALSDFPPAVHIPFDLLSVAAALALTLVSGLLVGLLPAITVARTDVGRAIHEAGARTAGSRRQTSARGAIVAAEIACALILVAGASLMARSLWNRRQRDLGFDPRGAVSAQLTVARAESSDPAREREVVRRVEAALAERPGVRAVGFVTYPIPAPFGTQIPLRVAGSPGDALGDETRRLVQSVTPGYFAAMGARLRSGRPFSPADRAGAAGVAIVNEDLARRVWPAGDAIGQTIAVRVSVADSAGGRAGLAEWRDATVVGVAGDIYRSAMHDRVQPTLYLPFDQFPGGDVTVVTRAAGPAAPLVAALKRTVFEVDRRLVVDNAQSLESDWAAFMRPTRLYATLLVIFGALALLLAATGVFASMAYSASQHTREWGIRLALGADSGALVRLVLLQGLQLAAVGVLAGVALALAMTRVLHGLLYGVAATDPLTLGATAALLVVVVLLACYVPARRTGAVDPVVALRAE